MKKSLYPILLTGIPLAIIFFTFFNPSAATLVKNSILVYTLLAIPYCLFAKDPRKGLVLFFLEASLLEGPWKHFTYGMNLKFLVYAIRDLLLYVTFLNFLLRKKQILPRETLSQKLPYGGIIFIFCLNIIIQIFNPSNFNYISAVANSRLFWEMIPLYWMGFYLMRNKSHFKALCWIILLCIFFNSAATIIQYFLGKEKVALISEGYKVMMYEWGRGFEEKLRAPGLGPDMGFSGGYFSQMFIMVIVLFIIPQFKNKQKRLLTLACLIALGIVSLAGLIASASRTAIVISVINLAILFFLRKDLIRKRLIKIIVISTLLLFLVIPYMLDMFKIVTQRYNTIKNPVALIKTITQTEGGRVYQAFVLPFVHATKFFMGNGLGKVGPGAGLFTGGLTANTNAENTLNLSITEIGTIGTVILLIFHIVVLRRGLFIYKRISDYEWKLYSTIPMNYMLLLLVYWQFGQLIIFPQNSAFWFMSGTLMGLQYLEK